MRNRNLILFMLLLSVVGLVVAGYQTYEHYFLSTSVCDISESLSCSVVTGSRFGEFPPGSQIPISLYGMAWWIALIGLLGGIYRGKEWVENMEFYPLAWTVIGLGTVAYLLWVELVALPAETGQVVICPFCTVQHVLIVLLVPLSYVLLEKPINEYITEIFYTEA